MSLSALLFFIVVALGGSSQSQTSDQRSGDPILILPPALVILAGPGQGAAGKLDEIEEWAEGQVTLVTKNRSLLRLDVKELKAGEAARAALRAGETRCVVIIREAAFTHLSTIGDCGPKRRSKYLTQGVAHLLLGPPVAAVGLVLVAASVATCAGFAVFGGQACGASSDLGTVGSLGGIMAVGGTIATFRGVAMIVAGAFTTADRRRSQH